MILKKYFKIESNVRWFTEKNVFISVYTICSDSINKKIAVHKNELTLIQYFCNHYIYISMC